MKIYNIFLLLIIMASCKSAHSMNLYTELKYPRHRIETTSCDVEDNDSFNNQEDHNNVCNKMLVKHDPAFEKTNFIPEIQVIIKEYAFDSDELGLISATRRSTGENSSNALSELHKMVMEDIQKLQHLTKFLKEKGPRDCFDPEEGLVLVGKKAAFFKDLPFNIQKCLSSYYKVKITNSDYCVIQ